MDTPSRNLGNKKLSAMLGSSYSKDKKNSVSTTIPQLMSLQKVLENKDYLDEDIYGLGVQADSAEYRSEQLHSR